MELTREPSVLMQNYESLEQDEKNIALILALAWIPVTSNQLKNIYHEANLDGSSPFYGTKNPLRPIENKGILVNRGGYVRIDHNFAHELCERYFLEEKEKFGKILWATDRVIGTYYWSYDWENDAMRKVRRARYKNDHSDFTAQVGASISQLNERGAKIVNFWFNNKQDSRPYYESFDMDILTDLLAAHIRNIYMNLLEPDEHISILLLRIHNFPDANQQKLYSELANLAFWQGRWEDADAYLAKAKDDFQTGLHKAHKLTLQGDFVQSSAQYEAWTKAARKVTRKRKMELTGLEGLLFSFSLFGLQDRNLLSRMEDVVKKQRLEENFMHVVGKNLSGVLFFLKNEKSHAQEVLFEMEANQPLHTFINILCKFLVDRTWLDAAKVRFYLDICIERGYFWPALELVTILSNLLPERTELDTQRKDIQESLAIQPLAHVFPPVEEWENALEQLMLIGKKGQKTVDREGSIRLAWLVDFNNWTLQAKEQVLGKSGWSKGKNISDKRLSTNDLAYMTAQDKRISEIMFSHNSMSFYHGYRENPALWRALVGHPYLFLEKSPDVAVQFVQEEPLLIASKEENGYRLSFSPPITDAGIQIVKETPTRYKLLEPTTQQLEIAMAFNGKSLFIPGNAEDKLTEVIEGLSTMVTVQSSLITDAENVDTVDADNRICVHLLPVGDGFHVEFYVKPFGATPPYFKPGEGESSVIALINGIRTLVKRDLDTENKGAKNLVKAVQILKEKKASKLGTWELEDAADCLQLLVQINPLLQAEAITLEWPKGEKMRISNVVGFDKFKMSVKSNNDWFEVNGEMELDSNRVITMVELIELSERSKSPFIEVNPGQFVALTEEFRKRLAQINGLMTKQKDGTLQLHSLAVSAFDPFTELLMEGDFDPAFLENKEKIRDAFNATYTLPSDFNATLRPYQLEGFKWLHRLAAWGVGACLADDMGLGKTVQALAFLTDRLKHGPTLVVAPASVCRNWMAETKKFAPLLTAHLFGETNRKKMVENAKEGDIVVVTYDLMTREEELFVEKEWGTIVLDEAQAIKNPGTRRSETAMQLNGKFKLAMSGTPLENHLGELWNLMRFLNPGLLGSSEQFQANFAGPIEKVNDDERREQLKRLVQPFILRRRKDEVLKDLPQKTEITLHVTLSPDERAFYEALRLKALDRIQANQDAHGGEKHLQILAELMRLRRAACHPQLADKNVQFSSSSKLDLFAETVSELIENGHKALVFSQFTGHLAILEAHLKKNNISYQYLDGSTPMKKRQERIEAFQGGEGDLFLISLKAGGVGLNLTAADYVIHMDPWWNPAVEDQATDRAHRIGQERPVTVYRLVAENTIEEKIIKLHEQKRDLADSLLEGTSRSAKMNADDLLALLSNEPEKEG